MPPIALSTIAAIIVPAGVSPGAATSEGPPPVLHITTYPSPSGRYALTVDPSHLHGQYGGTYTMRREGRVLWTQQLDFTLWEAAVTDEGVWAGYAYTHGWRGFAPRGGGGGPRGYGEYIAAVFDADGSPRIVDRRPRAGGRIHGPPDPVAQGCFVDEERLVVRFRAEREENAAERWEVYRLSDGEPRPEILLPAPPDAGSFALCLDARAVPGTGLALLVWSRTTWSPPRREGLILTLADHDGRAVWSKSLPDEFEGVENYSRWLLPASNLWATRGPDRPAFTYRSVARQARLTFELVADEAAPGGWRVEEAEPVAEQVVIAPWRTEALDLPEIVLEPRGVLELDAGAGDAPALGVSRFEFDSRGRIGFIPTEVGEQFELVLLDPHNDARRIPLGFDRETASMVPTAAWIGKDRWVVLRRGRGDPPETDAFMVDAATGNVQQVKGFSGPTPSTSGGIVGGGEHGFVILGDYRSNTVAAFDSQGRARWTVPNPGLSPQDVAVHEDGSVGVLLGTRKQIAVLGPDGGHVRTIELTETVGHLNYVAGLAPDADGGWILHDFNGLPPAYRLSADGHVKAGFAPRYPDGRAFGLHGGVRRAPDGRLWTSDRAAMLRLDDGGVVDLVLGREPEAESIGEVRAMTVADNGRIYVLDGRNAWVHEFDSDGKRLRILKPDPTDFVVGGGTGSITVAGDGGVYYRPDWIGLPGRGRYLKLNADGTRAGFERPIADEGREEWLFRPGSNERIVLAYERAFMVDARGRTTRTVERSADGKWLDKVHSGAVAPDGSFAVISRPSSWWSGDWHAVTLFSPDGEPIRTKELPASFAYARVAYNGRVACIVADSGLVILSAETGESRVFRFSRPEEGAWWVPHISPDGNEVWLHEGRTMRLHRYLLPGL